QWHDRQVPWRWLSCLLAWRSRYHQKCCRDGAAVESSSSEERTALSSRLTFWFCRHRRCAVAGGREFDGQGSELRFPHGKNGRLVRQRGSDQRRRSIETKIADQVRASQRAGAPRVRRQVRSG